eukprot:s1357_g14.t2
MEDVTIDDYFPVKYSQCAFASSGKKTEAWVQALETLGFPLHSVCAFLPIRVRDTPLRAAACKARAWLYLHDYPCAWSHGEGESVGLGALAQALQRANQDAVALVAVLLGALLAIRGSAVMKFLFVFVLLLAVEGHVALAALLVLLVLPLVVLAADRLYLIFCSLVGAAIGGSASYACTGLVVLPRMAIGLLVSLAAGLAALAFLRWRCFGWRLLSPPLGALLLTASLRYAFERVSGLQGQANWLNFADEPWSDMRAFSSDFGGVSFLCACGVLALLGWYVQFANLLGLEDPLVVPDHLLAFFDKTQAWFPFVFDGSRDPEEGMLESPSVLAPFLGHMPERYDSKPEVIVALSVFGVVLLFGLLSSRPLLLLGHAVLMSCAATLVTAGFLSGGDAVSLSRHVHFGGDGKPKSLVSRLHRHGFEVAGCLAALSALGGYACLPIRTLHEWLGYAILGILFVMASAGAATRAGACQQGNGPRVVATFQRVLGKMTYAIAAATQTLSELKGHQLQASGLKAPAVTLIFCEDLGVLHCWVASSMGILAVDDLRRTRPPRWAMHRPAHSYLKRFRPREKSTRRLAGALMGNLREHRRQALLTVYFGRWQRSLLANRLSRTNMEAAENNNLADFLSASLLAPDSLKGHAYSLLRVEEVEGNRLLQLRNPWGSTEWKGKWSDGDKDSWTQKMKKKLGYVNANDGSFWMAFEDFVNHYRSVYICRLFDDSWNRVFVNSEWRGETAGGCRNYPTYDKNPKIQLSIKGRVNLILTLEQADSRGGFDGDEEIPIGFRVYRDRSLSGNGVCGTSTYAYDRELCVDVELTENTAGPYIILPTTFKPNMERGFILKAFWKGAPDVEALACRRADLAPSHLWLKAASKVALQGEYIKVPNRLERSQALWQQAAGPGWLYSTSGGRWFVTDREEGIASNTGLLASNALHQGRLPQETEKWQEFVDGAWQLAPSVLVVADVECLHIRGISMTAEMEGDLEVEGRESFWQLAVRDRELLRAVHIVGSMFMASEPCRLPWLHVHTVHQRRRPDSAFSGATMNRMSRLYALMLLQRQGRARLRAVRVGGARRHEARSSTVAHQKVALVIGFIGSRYHGLQIHYDEAVTKAVTIEWLLRGALLSSGALEESKATSLERNAEWRHSSRTDAGVHACRLVITARQYPWLVSQLNDLLPDDVIVFAARLVPKSFDARYSCSWREYDYVVPASALFNQDATPTGSAALQSMRRLLPVFVGRHCFHNFTRLRGSRSRSRAGEPTLHSVDSFRRTESKLEACDAQVLRLPGSTEDFLHILLQGNRFLYNQIRYIIGAVAAVSAGYLPEPSLRAALCSSARFRFPVAPSCGLLLRSSGFTGTRQNPCDVAMDQEQVFSRMLPMTTRLLLDGPASAEAQAFEKRVLAEAAASWQKDTVESFRLSLMRARCPDEDLERLCATPRHLQPRALASHMCSAAARKGMACLPREGGSRGHRCGKVLGRESSLQRRTVITGSSVAAPNRPAPTGASASGPGMLAPGAVGGLGDPAWKRYFVENAVVSHANFSVFATWPPGHTGYSCGQDAGSSFGADGESGLCVAGTAGM